MTTSPLAGLRFPISIACGLLLTASLFTVLWSLTQATFGVIETTPLRIDFTRVDREETLERKRDPKVVREPPPTATELRPIVVRGESLEPTTLAPAEPVVVLSPGGIDVAGADREAVPLVRIEPTYPPRAAASGTEGWVRVQFDIGASGAVTNVAAVESEPGTVFDKAATDAVLRWRYNPSVVNGQAVERVGMQTLIRFNLESE